MGSSKLKDEADSAVAVDKAEKKSKKDKKRSESDGIHKSKKDKKDKKHKKEKLAQVLDEHLQASAAASAVEDEPKASRKHADSGDEDMKNAATAKVVIRGQLVEFALPIANEKNTKKIFKCVKKAAKNNALLRGVKEVNKALRKSPPKTPSTTASSFPGIIIIAGDISPAEVIMHLPLACEDVNAPYMFVTSRAELGAAAKTKRPTSVVMLVAEGKKRAAKANAAEDKDDDGEGYAEAYRDLAKLLQKEWASQMKGVI